MKNWKYDFLFAHRMSGWTDVPNLKNVGPIRNLFGESTVKEKATTRYFQYYVREDDRPRPLPAFMSRVIDAGKELECRKVISSDREPFNWHLRLSYFENDLFPVAAGLLALEQFSKGTLRSSYFFLPIFLP